MRVNVYAEEMTDKIEIISKTINGQTFTGLRFWLQLPVTLPSGDQVRGPFMHHPGDDDSSAVTFWGKQDLRAVLVQALKALDQHYGATPEEMICVDLMQQVRQRLTASGRTGWHNPFECPTSYLVQRLITNLRSDSEYSLLDVIAYAIFLHHRERYPFSGRDLLKERIAAAYDEVWTAADDILDALRALLTAHTDFASEVNFTQSAISADVIHEMDAAVQQASEVLRKLDAAEEGEATP